MTDIRSRPDLRSGPYPDPRLAVSRRLRATPFTSRVFERGAQAFTVYNHMLLPVEFESLAEDCRHLREAVQVWDVGAERQVSLEGPDATRLVQWMTPRDVSGVATDRCVYLPLVDENGRLLNDPVGLRLAEDRWWLSVADSDMLYWAKGLARGAGLDVRVHEPDVWPLAVQGPLADALMARVFGDAVADIRFFRHRSLEFRGHPLIVSRSGWSKQGGFEIFVDDAELGAALWDELFDVGADLDVRAGGPNLIERLEGGLLSYGNDMDWRHSPLEAGLGAFCSLDSDTEALSLEALRAERDAGPKRRLRGLTLAADLGPRSFDGAPFAHLGDEAGKSFIGSQVWSPLYHRQLATAMLDEPLASRDTLEVALSDGTRAEVRVTDLPFDFGALGA